MPIKVDLDEVAVFRILSQEQNHMRPMRHTVAPGAVILWTLHPGDAGGPLPNAVRITCDDPDVLEFLRDTATANHPAIAIAVKESDPAGSRVGSVPVGARHVVVAASAVLIVERNRSQVPVTRPRSKRKPPAAVPKPKPEPAARRRKGASR